MTTTTYELASFIADLRAITSATSDPRRIVDRVRTLVHDLAISRTWLTPKHYECDTTQGFGAHLLHEEPDHTLAIFAAAWLPGRGAPPHNHGTWAVVAGVDGPERNVFWKRLDEQCVSPGTYDLLYRNGLRVGRAPFSEWEFVKEMIARNPGEVTKLGTVAPEAKNVPIAMRQDVRFQTIAHFDADEGLRIRDYEACENIINLSFQPVPRKPGQLLLALAPMVRLTRTALDFTALHQVRQHVRGIGVTLFVNWLVKPFSMALLAWIFVRHLFAPWLPADQLDSYVAGLILLAAAPCTAMVFVWSRLSNGDPLFTLSQVALNDTIMVFAFAPIVALLLGISSISVPWETLITSVVLYIVIPVIVAQIWRKSLLKDGGPAGQAHFDAAMRRIGPWSITALLATLLLLFAFQGEAILEQPLVIALLAVPIFIQVVLNSGLAYWLNRKMGVAHCVAGPSALIGASNFFELAVATAISLFGFQSGAALATVVGVLIEVPVMLAVVAVVNRSAGWYEHGLRKRTP